MGDFMMKKDPKPKPKKKDDDDDFDPEDDSQLPLMERIKRQQAKGAAASKT